MARKARIWYKTDDGDERTGVYNVESVELCGNTFEIMLEDSTTADFYADGLHYLE